MTRIALITGATAGFGEAISREFAKNGYHLILTGRREHRLASLKRSLEKEHGIECLTLCFDVQDRTAVLERFTAVPDEWQRIEVLVNNAGLASGMDAIQTGDIDDWDKMIDTNVKGLLYVSKSVLPGMVQRKRGHVINIGSTAGKEVYAKGNVYCASKHAVDAITKGMRIDLLGTGVKVTQIAPGAAETEFSEVRFHGDKERAKAVYDGYQPMAAEDIALLTYYVTTLPPHLCINDLVVTSLSQANSYYIHRDD
ncbi:MAG: SDR family NAD(P)-dependent oxidoreductase [Cryomorphaceae bacterium]